MGIDREIVVAEIIGVIPAVHSKGEFDLGLRYSPGYVNVATPWGYFTLINGSVQGIPSEHRVVGRRVVLRWAKSGGYCGPMFAGLPLVEQLLAKFRQISDLEGQEGMTNALFSEKVLEMAADAINMREPI